VYKSYDSEGNVVFSDTPTKNANKVEISKTNVSDSFEIPPSTASNSEKEPEPKTKPVEQPVVQEDIIDTNQDGRISRREIDHYREEMHRRNREARKAAEKQED